MDNIVRQAAVSSQTFYDHFWDKHDLLLNSLDGLVEELARQQPYAHEVLSDERLYREMTWEWGALSPREAGREFPRLTHGRKPDTELIVFAPRVADQPLRVH